MFPTPQALGLMICERVIIEQGTKNPSLIGIFLAINVDEFPAAPAPFSVFAALTSGLGSGMIEVTVVSLETDEQIYVRGGRVEFPDRLAVVNIHFRVSEIRFPSPGPYELAMFIDGEVIAQRRFKVKQREPLP